MKEFIISFVSGTLGGLLVLLTQKILDKRDKSKQDEASKVVNPQKHLRQIQADFLRFVTVGLSIDKMKEYLGVPDNISDRTLTYFTDSDEGGPVEILINSYFYRFTNATVEIISKNNVSIDAISVFNHGGSEPAIEVNTFYGEPVFIGKSTFDEELVSDPVHSFYHTNVRERFLGVEQYYGRLGGYFHYSFFATDYDVELRIDQQFQDTKDPRLFIGQTICGCCISNRETYAPYISEYE
jgi:hypothetical protein